MAKVSIVVPIYNVSKFLPECLDSIKKQKLKDIEVILVDDGSTDNSLDIIKSYVKKDKRFKFITKKNSGYGNSMNRGMAMATGEYIGIVESDDYIDKNMFYDLYKTAKKFDADVVKSDYYEFSTSNGKKKQRYINTVFNTKFYNRPIYRFENDIIFHFQMNTWTGIYRTDFIRENNIRHNETPGASYQDNGFFFQTISIANPVVFVNKAYYHYRQDNPNSSINSKGKVFCMCDEYKYIREFIEKNPDIKKHYLKVFLVKKYFNYMYTYKRIANEFKIQFLERFAKEFNDSLQNHEFDDSLMDWSEMSKLKRIMADPKQFYYDDEIWCLNQKVLELVNYKNYLKTELDKANGK